MKITILTLFPNMISGFFEESIVRRAIDKGIVKINLVNLRDFATDNYGSVDDRPYGGGVGMIMRVDIINTALSKFSNPTQNSKSKNRTIITSPRGKIFNQTKAREYAELDNLVIIAGHYEGVDERVNDLVDEEISLGDFVLTGGEIVAATITDSVVRLLPQVLKKEEAVQLETFFEIPIKQLVGIIGENGVLEKLTNKGIKKVKLLEYPQYTRPEDFKGKKVPEVLLSGNHKEIEKWRIKKAFNETFIKRPDLLM